MLYAGAMMAGNNDELCPFCRTPAAPDEETYEREKKRVEVGDAQAIHNLACDYSKGGHGSPQNRDKALELWHRAGELGHSESNYNIGIAYSNGRGVEQDDKKAIHYWELAAMRGNANARHNHGVKDYEGGNYDRALKHFMIASGSGSSRSLTEMKQLYTNGHATKDDYGKAFEAYQAYLDDIRSDQRDEAAAFKDKEAKYYEL